MKIDFDDNVRPFFQVLVKKVDKVVTADLNDDQVKLLNGIPFPDNNFLNIEFCKLEVIKLFPGCCHDA